MSLEDRQKYIKVIEHLSKVNELSYELSIENLRDLGTKLATVQCNIQTLIFINKDVAQ